MTVCTLVGRHSARLVRIVSGITIVLAVIGECTVNVCKHNRWSLCFAAWTAAQSCQMRARVACDGPGRVVPVTGCKHP